MDQLERKLKKYIIAFGAHADDIDLRAGATFVNYVKSGYELIYVVVSTSASGIPDIAPNEAYIIRQEEAKQAAQIYNTKPVFLNFQQCIYPPGPFDKLPQINPTLALASQDEKSILIVRDLIQQYKPAIIFTHSPDDLHEDHYHTSVLVYRAFQKIRDGSPFPQLWLWEHGNRGTIAGFSPNKYIEVSEAEIHEKDKAIKSHKSQYARCAWFETFAVDNARYWGEKIGKRYAEAFIEIT